MRRSRTPGSRRRPPLHSSATTCRRSGARSCSSRRNPGTCSYAASRGLAPLIAEGSRIRIGQGVAGRVAQAREPLLVQDVRQATSHPLLLDEHFTTGSFISFPLVYHGELVGVVNLTNRASTGCSCDDDLERVQVLALVIALVDVARDAARGVDRRALGTSSDRSCRIRADAERPSGGDQAGGLRRVALDAAAGHRGLRRHHAAARRPPRRSRRSSSAFGSKGETADEVTGAARALQRAMVRCRWPIERTSWSIRAVRAAARYRTFNISTAAALRRSAARASAIAKHGNRSFTHAVRQRRRARSSSASRWKRPVELAARALDEAGIVFMYAPTMHPAMRHVGPVRREIAVPDRHEHRRAAGESRRRWHVKSWASRSGDGLPLLAGALAALGAAARARSARRAWHGRDLADGTDAPSPKCETAP